MKERWKKPQTNPAKWLQLPQPQLGAEKQFSASKEQNPQESCGCSPQRHLGTSWVLFHPLPSSDGVYKG